jgi:hypothetical protein
LRRARTWSSSRRTSFPLFITRPLSVSSLVSVLTSAPSKRMIGGFLERHCYSVACPSTLSTFE